ncbi:MAG: hypothetical protein APF76_15755 [Desulfitibacter sp. BRH_c19]|nr:MAG: hypothetical protein APF76_15755 [Desulfitibacter sp. BRH_c19]
MITIVEKTIARYDLLQQNDKILVAVSGGADSLALLHCLNLLKNKYELTLIVAHLNHMFRGMEADRDAEYVKQVADKLGLQSIIEKINVPEVLAENNYSPQEGARVVRYGFLRKTAKDLSCNKIALGHHKDDQAETILLNLLKGAGLDGLKGIAPKRDLYIRPLLEVKKEVLERYCEENKLSVRIDLSNFKEVYLRNKIRNSLMPLLIKDFNPRLVDVLATTADILREENAYLEENAENLEIDCRISINKEKQKGEWLTQPFLELPIAIQRRIIRQIFFMVSGNNYNLSFYHVESVRNLISYSSSGSTTELPGQLKAIFSYDRLKIMRKEEYYSEESIDYYHEMSIPGTLLVQETNTIIESKFLSPSETMERLELKDRNEALVSINPGDTLIIRNRRTGDRMRPVGMTGTKKLKDLFIDEKIDKLERNRLPIILSKQTGKIIWVAGLRISEEFKNTLDKNSILLRISKYNNGEFMKNP